MVGNFKTHCRGKATQEAASASQDPIASTRDPGLERGADSALLPSKQGLQPRSNLESFVTHPKALLSLSRSSRMSEN